MIYVLLKHGLNKREFVEHRYLYTKVMDELSEKFTAKGRNYKIVTHPDNYHPYAMDMNFQQRYDYEQDLLRITNFIRNTYTT